MSGNNFLHPPFPWHDAEVSYLKLRQEFLAVELRLEESREILKSHFSDGEIKKYPWFNSICFDLKKASVISSGFFDALVDRDLSVELIDFVDWFTTQIVAEPDKIEESLKIYADLGIFRNKGIASYRSDGRMDMCYYHQKLIVSELNNLIYVARMALNNLPRLVAIFGISANFIAIHPFSDGNGRASRLLINKLFNKTGIWDGGHLPLGAFIYRDRRRYAESQRALLLNNEWEGFLRYSSLVISAAAEFFVLREYSKSKSWE